MLATAVRDLKSPQNVGTTVRSHVAFGGGPFLFVGRDAPWRFAGRTQAFSRRLERLCQVVDVPTDNAFFDWCRANDCTPIALEIGPLAVPLRAYRFPPRSVLIAGHESFGLPEGFVRRCQAQVVVEQFGPVGSLNVAVAASIALHERAAQHGIPARIDADEYFAPRLG